MGGFCCQRCCIDILDATASADFLARLADGAHGMRRGARHLVAVSGGRDSMVLLEGLGRIGFRNLAVVHVNHRLRGRASEADARFVVKACERLGWPVLVVRAETRGYAEARGESIERAARELRHGAFARAARELRCARIFLAHHADDQIETCLFRYLRGTGAAGLAGMRDRTAMQVGRRRLELLRPMLRVRRSLIDGVVAEWKVRYREDATNAESGAARNRLRNEVLPVIYEHFGDSAADAILRAVEIFRGEDEWMDGMVSGIAVGSELAVGELQGQPIGMQRRVVRRWLEGNGLGETGFAEVERVLALLDVVDGPAKVNLPGGVHARRRAGRIFLEVG